MSWPAAYYTDCACHANVYLRNCTTSPTDNMYSSQHKQHQLPGWRSIRPHTATTQRMYTRAYHTNIHTFIRTSIYIHANTTSTHTHTHTQINTGRYSCSHQLERPRLATTATIQCGTQFEYSLSI